MKLLRKRARNLCLGLGALSLLSGTGAGQAAAQEGIRTIEEITVTARKRDENLQDVGFSLSAISAEEIEQNFAYDLRDLAHVSPNLVLDDTAQGPGGVAAAYIRGIGVSEVEKNFDPAVGVVVDGVFLGTMSGGITRALDLEAVEVLRGPQGTLFGRNTIGGVINLRRSKPTGEFGLKARAGYGNYETGETAAIINFAATDNLAVKLSGAYTDRGEGYYQNANTGRDEGRLEYFSGGANLLYALESVELEYTLQMERTQQDTPPLLYVGQPGQLFCSGVNFGICAPNTRDPLSGDRWKTTQQGVGPDDASFDADTHIFEIRWDINDALRLDYIFGIWETEEQVLTDWDATPQELFHTARPAEYEQKTHELRLTHDDGIFTGTVGAYLWDSEYEIRLRSFIGFNGFVNPPLNLSALANPVFLDIPQTSAQSSDSFALFFEGDYRFSDSWVLTLGGRFTWDEKDTVQRSQALPAPTVIPGSTTPGTPLGPPNAGTNAEADHSWNEFTPKAGARYEISDDWMLYGTYSVGYRSGGFNGRVDSPLTATTPYNQETVDNYELGFKSTLFGDTMRLNGALFYMEYDDKQEELQLPSGTSGTGQVTRVTNASTAEVWGVELDLLYYITEELSLRGNLGHLDAEYDQFSFTALDANGMRITRDFSHLNFRRAPEWTLTASANYTVQIGADTLRALLAWHYIGEHEVDFANKPELSNEAQHLINASLSYDWRAFTFSAFARNLLEEDGYGIGFDVAGLWSYAATRPPRTFGFQILYAYGDES